MTGVAAFATEKVGRAERIEYWRELAWKDLGAFDVHDGEAGFSASVKLRQLGEIRTAYVRAHEHRISRSAAQSRGDDRRIFKIVLPHSGKIFLDQHDQRITLQPGDWALYDTTSAFSFSCTDDSSQIALLVRAEDLHLNDLAPYSMKLFSGASGYSSMLRTLIATATDDASEACPEGDVGLVIARLARLALLEHGSHEGRRSSREVMRERIDSYVDMHLGRGELTIDTVARGLNCSKRYLHKVFIDNDQTLSSYILHRRLEACRTDLIDPASPHKTVTDVAYAWGFSSLAYFSRVFKQSFGMSPREYRARWLCQTDRAQ